MVIVLCCTMSLTARTKCEIETGHYIDGSQYVCDYLCSGTYRAVHKVVMILDTLTIDTEDGEICAGTEGIYYTHSEDSLTWRIFDAEFNLVDSVFTDTLFYIFDEGGIYRIDAYGTGYCDTATRFVTVHSAPPAITTVAGSDMACLWSSILLQANVTDPNYYLRWQPDCLSALPHSVEGDAVTISYGAEVCDVNVYQVDRRYGCVSSPYRHSVDTFRLQPIDMPPQTTVCAGSELHFTVPDQSDNVLYEWTIDPICAASVLGDHRTNDVMILTNYLIDVPLPLTVSVILKRTCCGGYESYDGVRILLVDKNMPVLQYDTVVCVGESVSFSVMDTATPQLCRWVFDDGEENGTSIQHRFRTSGRHEYTLFYSLNSQSGTQRITRVVNVNENSDTPIPISDSTLYVGSVDTISCVPRFSAVCNCEGSILLTDRSFYDDHLIIPDRIFRVSEYPTHTVIMHSPDDTAVLSVSGLPAGIYTIEMHIPLSMDTCVLTQKITIGTAPKIYSMNVSGSVCGDTPFLCTAEASSDVTEFRWEFEDGSYNFGNSLYHTYFSVLNSMTSTMTVSNAAGCSTTAHRQISVKENELEAHIFFIDTLPVCHGQSCTLFYDMTQPSIINYIWNNSDTLFGRFYKVNHTGNYRVRAVDISGCSAESMINVPFLNAPSARIIGKSEFYLGDTVELTGNSGDHNSYEWNVTGARHDEFSEPNIAFPSSIADKNATVILTVTNSDNCSATASHNIVVH